MKEVNIKMKVKFDYSLYRGRGITVFEYGGRSKEVIELVEERTCNRGIFFLLTKAIQSLKEPCIVSVYLQCNIGDKFLTNGKKKWVNRDLGDILNSAIHSGGHEVTFIDCSRTDEGKLLQKFLVGRLRA